MRIKNMVFLGLGYNKHLLKLIIGLETVMGVLTGCTSDPRVHADKLAKAGKMQHEQFEAGSFILTSFVRITRTDLPLTIYIEGDGRAFRKRNAASDNPTPHQAMALSLAATDTSANVVYLARPCQFTPQAENPNCSQSYWTDKRFASDVIAAMDNAVTRYAARVPMQNINLVGYSGGGAVAVLIASRRQDVASLITVAGNLDHEAVNRKHKVALMPMSLNAIDYVSQIKQIPQLHFSGSADKIVPTEITRTFVNKVGTCARLHIVEGLSHEGDWGAQWPSLVSKTLPTCSDNAKRKLPS